MTLYMALAASRHSGSTTDSFDPPYQEKIFQGANQVPIYGWVAIPDHPMGTIIGTYGITGSLENQWYLRIWGKKAYEEGYAVVLFDWRGHGKTMELSPEITSDGIYEGEDYVHIAAQAKQMGCPAPMLLTGYSLGGQLALWGIKTAQEMGDDLYSLGLEPSDILGSAVICPNLESNRSLAYLTNHWLGRHLEKAIVNALKALVEEMNQYHPGTLDAQVISRFDSIRSFDHELVIDRLGFQSVEEYYRATSPLYFLPDLQKPTFIIYAEDDPLFTPDLIPDIRRVCDQNPVIDLCLTPYGGHVGYLSSQKCQNHCHHPDPWWAWNQILTWWKGVTDRDYFPETARDGVEADSPIRLRQ